jgi:hypothetical protein
VSGDLDLSKLSHTKKETLILALSACLDAALMLIGELQARIEDPHTARQDAEPLQRAAVEGPAGGDAGITLR